MHTLVSPAQTSQVCSKPHLYYPQLYPQSCTALAMPARIHALESMVDTAVVRDIVGFIASTTTTEESSVMNLESC